MPRLLGRQEPRILSCATGDFIEGGTAVSEFAELSGLNLDPWQRLVVDVTHRRHRESKLLVHNRVGLIVPRQNGKGSILEAVELAWLFLSREPLILHSAHEFKTAADAFKRLKHLIESVPELVELVQRFNNSHGQEGIIMRDGREMKFIARTSGSGRGFPATKVVLDEAYNLKEEQIAAILPTLGAAKDGQLWYTSTPVNKEYHDNGTILAAVRNRGLAERVEGDSHAYLEWSVPDDTSNYDFADRELWRWNPALGIRISEEFLKAELDEMARKTFGVEHLGKGDWPDPERDSSVISRADWNELLDTDSKIDGRRVFTIDVAPLGNHASVSVSGRRSDGLVHAEVVRSDKGVSWVIPFLRELCGKWNPLGLLYDPRAASAAMATDMATLHVPVFEVSGTQVAQAFSEFVQKTLHDKTIRHPHQPSLVDALEGATTRFVGDAGMAWDRKNATIDITGLVSITNAVWYFGRVEAKDVCESVW